MNAEDLKLSKLDKKLLYELDIDARQSLTSLGKKVRASPALIEYRLKRMQEFGLIKKYITFLDAGKLGLMVWNVYISLQNTTKKIEDEIVRTLCHLKKTWWVARTSGRWDIIYSLCVKDVKEFYNIVTEIHNRFGKYILNQSIVAHTEVEIISRGYFTNSLGKSITWYENVESPNLNSKDIQILKLLSENARLSIVDISKKTRLNAKTISNRIKELKRKGIISKFRLQLDVKKMGFSFYKVIVYLKNFTHKKNSELKEYCIKEGNIFHYEQKVGPWILELELDAESYEKADKQMKEMKEHFPDFIRNYELLLVSDEPKGELDLTKML